MPGKLVRGCARFEPVDNLSRHVFRRSHHHPRPGFLKAAGESFGNAEVCQNRPVFLTEDNVSRLDIPVDISILMCILERFSHLPENPERFLPFQRSLLFQQLIQGPART